MLLVSSPKAELIEKALHGKEIKGISFKVLGKSGLSLTVDHNADDASAKAIVKKLITTDPMMAKYYANIQYIDENGKIL